MVSTIEPLLSELNIAVGQAKDGAIPEQARMKALQAATKLAAALEKPEDALLKIAYSPAICMAIRSGVQMNIFSVLSEKEETSAQELARRSGANEVLIRRLLRPLTAAGYVAEKGPGVYGPTAISRQLHQRVTEGMVKFIWDLGMPSITAAPHWLSQHGWQLNPTDATNGPFQAGHKTDLDMFGFALANKEKFWDDMNTFFEGDRGSRPHWAEWFPVQDKLLGSNVLKSDAPVIVDVGGGRGHDIAGFRKHFPDLSGRLVLQDQQPVLDSIVELDSSIEERALDFFNEAPVPGARIYFLKFIMHDWSDEDCLRILENVKTAMEEGYSYLAIEEFILPDEGCSLLPTEWDLMMMIYLCGMERTKSHWTSLLERADFAIEGFYHPPRNGQGIIIAELGKCRSSL